VVYGASDPKTGAAGGLLNVFDTTFNHQTKVQGDVMAKECGELLRDFFKTKRSLAKG
jgi:tRNA(adenine34) deaminase